MNLNVYVLKSYPNNHRASEILEVINNLIFIQLDKTTDCIIKTIIRVCYIFFQWCYNAVNRINLSLVHALKK